MTDGELDNPDEWGEPVPSKRPKSEKRRRHVVVSTRLTPDELAAIERAAMAQGARVSSFLRSSALQHAWDAAANITLQFAPVEEKP